MYRRWLSDMQSKSPARFSSSSTWKAGKVRCFFFLVIYHDIWHLSEVYLMINTPWFVYTAGVCPPVAFSRSKIVLVHLRTIATHGAYRRIGHTEPFTWRAVTQKLETQNKKEDQISTPHPPDNAESEVFSEVRVPGVRFFWEKVILYGEVTIKNRYLEAKPLEFSPPKSLCGTVGSHWVSLATLFGFWETLIKFSESMILYRRIGQAGPFTCRDL